MRRIGERGEMLLRAHYQKALYGRRAKRDTRAGLYYTVALRRGKGGSVVENVTTPCCRDIKL